MQFSFPPLYFLVGLGLRLSFLSLSLLSVILIFVCALLPEKNRSVVSAAHVAACMASRVAPSGPQAKAQAAPHKLHLHDPQVGWRAAGVYGELPLS